MEVIHIFGQMKCQATVSCRRKWEDLHVQCIYIFFFKNMLIVDFKQLKIGRFKVECLFFLPRRKKKKHVPFLYYTCIVILAMKTYTCILFIVCIQPVL